MARDATSYDVIVVGGGHAGCEAALAAARMGMRTALFTLNLDAIARMSCNPAIGGLAKGQLVREIDALGGEMGKVIDQTGIQFRMLNTSKGPAVRSPRAQADKYLYHVVMKQCLERQPGLSVVEQMVDAISVKDGKVVGIVTHSGELYSARTVVVTTGTFLKGLIHVGDKQSRGGRIGEPSADNLSDSLRELGFEIGRLKTGTPPRVNGRTIDYEVLDIQHGDKDPRPFSFETEKIERPQVPCHITYTNPRTHDIVRANLDRAPLYSGQITGVGPRYCPSIEDKIVRFAEREHHQMFLEPEGLDTDDVYCNGISTSIPQDVQEEMVHSIKGLENAEIVRYGYAIEYDFVPPTQTMPSLETKLIRGLFLAGQINGTSGYEEAAAQGIVAGINSVLSIRDEEPFVMDRSEAYIGVLIDDLVTKGTKEPYRMFTSRAEHRLVLRQDNADRRLTKHGYKFGLISDERWARFEQKERLIAETEKYISEQRHQGKTLAAILRQQRKTFADVEKLDDRLADKQLPDDVIEQVEIETKYRGYIERQAEQIEKFRRMEESKLPQWIDYDAIPELSNEAREKLAEIRPVSLGPASRISGVSPADVTILMVYLKGRRAP